MVNTEIRLIIFFAAKDGEALYSQQKQDQELTVAQIMDFLLPNFRKLCINHLQLNMYSFSKHYKGLLHAR